MHSMVCCRWKVLQAIIYRPFSVNALGVTLVFAYFVVEIFDRKICKLRPTKLKYIILRKFIRFLAR